MKTFIMRPSIDRFQGVTVDKDKVLEYHNEQVEQTVENLVLHTVAKASGEGYESTCETTIHLSEGDILLFEEGGRGYIKPVGGFCTAEEAIEDLKVLMDFDNERENAQ